MKKGKLIVFEGSHCSGKSTQIDLLINRLKGMGRGVVTFDFPDYSTPTGKVVRRYLDGGFGPANEVPAKVASVFYAEDRFASKGFIQDELEKGNVAILDRYVESSMGHQGGKIRSESERESFFEWLRELEYGNFELPKPDAVVFLYMPYAVSQELMGRRGREPRADGKLDGHEGNEGHMRNAEESYLHLAKLYGWIMIDCAPDGTMGSLKTPEQIHEELWEKLSEVVSDNEVVLDMRGINVEERERVLKILEKMYNVRREG